jgi:hypothetical protein
MTASPGPPSRQARVKLFSEWSGRATRNPGELTAAASLRMFRTEKLERAKGFEPSTLTLAT